MKVLFTDATLQHGGAERVISILANELVEMGHEVEVLLYYDLPIWYELDERIRVVTDEQRTRKGNPLKHIRFRRKYFRASDADVIISFLAPINMVSIVSAMGAGKKLIVADRNDPRRTPTNPLVRRVRDFLYRFADGVVLQNETNRQYFPEKVRKKSAVIYNPVDVGAYGGSGIQAEKRDEIVSVGRLIDQKNPLMLLQAFRKVAETHPSCRLVYYGEGNLTSAIRDAAKEMGIADKVATPGAVKDVFDRIRGSRLFVMTSQYEGMPNALIEAMCIGLPVISTRVSGAVDLIEDRVNGMLVDCGDVDSLAEKMSFLLDHGEVAGQYAAEAAKLASQLTAGTIVSEWLSYIQAVTGA